MTKRQTAQNLETEVFHMLYLPYIYIQALLLTLLYTLKYGFNIHPFGHTCKHILNYFYYIADPAL